jgi:addiction module HigA family antidote
MKDDMKHGRRPCHPGEILREDCLPELGMTADQLADAAGAPRAEMSLLVSEQISVSPFMAQCLAAKVGPVTS